MERKIGKHHKIFNKKRQPADKGVRGCWSPGQGRGDGLDGEKAGDYTRGKRRL
jgi:hypothetical protein